MKFNSDQIVVATKGTSTGFGEAGELVTDSRKLHSGSWFCALVGPNFDGHDYAKSALEAGAIGLIVSRPVDVDLPQVLVEDTTKALQDLGRAARARFSGPVVGLTGSSGKTTTRTLIALALKPLGEVHQTVGNLNNHLGVPMTLLACPDRVAVQVIEMGTSSPGEIAFLAKMANPTVRLILNVGPAHLLELGGLEGVAQEKGALFVTAQHGQTLVVNLDDERVAALPRPDGTRCVTFGRGGDVSVMSTSFDVDRWEQEIVFDVRGTLYKTTLPSPGDHIALDAAAAVAVGLALHDDVQQAVQALSRYSPVGMRMKRQLLPGGAMALNDAYNANPQSMKASLQLLASLPGSKIAVLGDMLELGAMEKELHRQVLEFAVGLGVRVVAVGPRMGLASEGLGVTVVADPADVGARLGALSKSDVILFKGSRGAKVERALASVMARE